MRELILTQGKVALVDDEDFERLNDHRWQAHKRVRKNGIAWYARRTIRRSGVAQTHITMHREILRLAKGIQVDHHDGDGLNNQQNNLRAATQSQNNQNARKQVNKTSRFKGVSWYKKYQKWNARIQISRHLRHLGYFMFEGDAAQAYDNAARRIFGEFALLNFPD